jgi:hypothetical protein
MTRRRRKGDAEHGDETIYADDDATSMTYDEVRETT